METRVHRSFFLTLLFWIFFSCGCTSKEQPFFTLQTDEKSAAPSKSLLFLIQDSATPSSINSTLILEENKIPDGSLYLDITQISADSTLFQLNVKAKNLIGIYDTPMTIVFDPSFVEPELANGSLQLTEGSELSRLRKSFGSNSRAQRIVALKGSLHPSDSKRLIVAHSLLENIGLSQVYTGTLFSISMRVLTPGTFRTIIGIDLVGTELYDRSGKRLTSNFYGGILTKEL